MPKRVQLRSFQIGAPRRPGEGLRIGTTRRPPRGVPRKKWRSGGYFDVWLPEVAPSNALLRRYQKKIAEDERMRRKFFAAYERELKQPAQRHLIEFLAALAGQTPIAVGCFCRDESRCHRSVLLRVIRAWA